MRLNKMDDDDNVDGDGDGDDNDDDGWWFPMTMFTMTMTIIMYYRGTAAVQTSPAFGPNNTIIFGSDDFYAYAIREADGY